MTILSTSTTLDDAALSDVVEQVEQNGYAVVPDILDQRAADAVLERLWTAATESERRGLPNYAEGLDPNPSNVRVWNLIDLDPVFAELIAHPVADAIVSGVLGADYIISNFTANIARPGSGSMMVHSDQSLVLPPPWHAAHTMNIIWCLTDVHPANGATLYLPGSHRLSSPADVPPAVSERMVAFSAPAGAIVALEGRVWHTSGCNVTEAEDRALLFGFYSQPFVRPQWNHSVGLSASTQAACSETMRYRLGLDAWQNVPHEETETG
jgi:ectoine hydroxylase-related dioxygenase (phytanoyl-CoA dioxygenase family)